MRKHEPCMLTSSKAFRPLVNMPKNTIRLQLDRNSSCLKLKGLLCILFTVY